jgi:hypothetical protein
MVVGEPIGCAVAAAGAMNAIAVRGVGVALVLAARLAVTALAVAAGRGLLDGRFSGVKLAVAALPLSAAIQLFAALTPYFPSNRMPGDTPLYVASVLAYYTAWVWYLIWRCRTDPGWS